MMNHAIRTKSSYIDLRNILATFNSHVILRIISISAQLNIWDLTKNSDLHCHRTISHYTGNGDQLVSALYHIPETVYKLFVKSLSGHGSVVLQAKAGPMSYYASGHIVMILLYMFPYISLLDYDMYHSF